MRMVSNECDFCEAPPEFRLGPPPSPAQLCELRNLQNGLKSCLTENFTFVTKDSITEAPQSESTKSSFFILVILTIVVMSCAIFGVIFYLFRKFHTSQPKNKRKDRPQTCNQNYLSADLYVKPGGLQEEKLCTLNTSTYSPERFDFPTLPSIPKHNHYEYQNALEMSTTFSDCFSSGTQTNATYDEISVSSMRIHDDSPVFMETLPDSSETLTSLQHKFTRL